MEIGELKWLPASNMLLLGFPAFYLYDCKEQTARWQVDTVPLKGPLNQLFEGAGKFAAGGEDSKIWMETESIQASPGPSSVKVT